MKTHGTVTQPPSGGCVLKLLLAQCEKAVKVQPPSGGCVLKLDRNDVMLM